MSSGGDPSRSAGGAPAWCRWGLLFTAYAILVWAPGAAAICEDAATSQAVNAALGEIEASLDPCGESFEVIRVVRAFRQCARNGYRVCLSYESTRNFIESGARAPGAVTTITWNPGLRAELERGCGGRSERPVLRDPTAQLLHEVVHAVQDCAGLDPAEHELEAVRVENIYRRARGFCQRTRYGEEPLPAAMMVACDPGNCRCGPAAHLQATTATQGRSGAADTSTESRPAGDIAASRAAGTSATSGSNP